MATCASDVSTLMPKSLGRRLQLNVTDVLLGMTLVWCVVPETLTGDIYFYAIPLRFVLLFSTTICSMISTLFLGVSQVTSYMKVALVAMFCMAVLGLYQGNDLKFWVIDVSYWTAFIFGLYWGGRYSRQHTINTLYWWSMAISIVLLLNILGLLLGFVPQAGEGERLYSYSLFTSAAFVTCMIPLWFTAETRGHELVIPRRARVLAIVGIGCVLFCSILTATRSIFLTAIVALTIVLWLRLHGRNAAFWMFTTLASSLIVTVYIFSADSTASAEVAGRLSSTNIVEEYRYVELLMMFEDLEGSFLTGKGFGSRFESCIGQNGDFLAFAPHVAIFTSLLKGGVPAFVLLVVLPLGAAIYQLARLNGNAISLSCSAAVVLYCAQAFMSGGWNFVALFILGVTITLASRCKMQKSKSPNSLRS